MSTLAPSSPLSDRPDRPDRLDAPRPPWRALALLASLVLAVHLALLALAPTATGPRPSPLADKFITRTIVIAPPPGAEPASAAPAPAAEAPPKPAAPRPVARPVFHPRPAATPAQAPGAPSEPTAPSDSPIAPPAVSPDLVAEANAAAEAVEAEEAKAAAAASAAAAPAARGTGSGTGTEAGGGKTAGDIAGPVALQIPGSVRLAFAATAQRGAQPMQGVFGELDWLQDGTHYDADLSWTFLFKTLRSQHSTGSIGPGGIEPLRYSDSRKNEVAANLVREQGRIDFTNNAPSLPLMPGAQDRLSIVMQLGGLMAGNPARYPPGAVISMQTVGPRDAEVWSFVVGDSETLDLPAGSFEARKLTRNARKPQDDKIELWLAPALGWLPVRIRQTQPNGDYVDLALRSKMPLERTN